MNTFKTVTAHFGSFKHSDRLGDSGRFIINCWLGHGRGLVVLLSDSNACLLTSDLILSIKSWPWICFKLSPWLGFFPRGHQPLYKTHQISIIYKHQLIWTKIHRDQWGDFQKNTEVSKIYLFVGSFGGNSKIVLDIYEISVELFICETNHALPEEP